MYYNESKLNKADGSVIYVKSNSEYQIDNVEIDKVTFLSINLKLQNTEYKITSTYRCHQINKEKYIKSFNKFLINIKKDKNHLIIGDFNIDILDNDTHSQDFMNNFFENEFIPLFNHVTRPNQSNINGGTCIDNMFIKSPNPNCVESHKLNQLFGDHYPIFATINLNFSHDSNVINSNSIDYKKLHILASRFDWNSVYNITDLDHALDYIIEALKYFVLYSTKSNNLTKNKKFKKRQPWITNGIIHSSITKNKLFDRTKKNPDNQTYKLEYKLYLKNYKKTLSIAKANYNKKQVQGRLDNARKLWQFINSKINNKAKNKFQINYITTEKNHKIYQKKLLMNLIIFIVI